MIEAGKKAVVVSNTYMAHRPCRANGNGVPRRIWDILIAQCR